VQDVRVKRVLLSEKDRVGIGTFQPKDEKNQDSTELTGDIAIVCNGFKDFRHYLAHLRIRR
jgi:predicted Ser/Thr protein kinase